MERGLKRLHLVQDTEPLEYQTKGLCTSGGYLQGIRRITAEFERALYYC